MRRLHAGVVFGILTLFFVGPARPQATSPMAGPPDVLVLIYQRPGIGDQVGITYPRLVPHAQIQRDLSTLAQEGGWMMSQIHISDARSPLQSQSRIGAMTSASFVAPGVIQNATNRLPIEPFIRAFQAENSLRLIFVVSSDFTFQGVTQYADKNVQIALDQHGAAYTYQVHILNHQLDWLNLPQTAQVTDNRAASGKKRSPLFILLSIMGAAAATGMVVYWVTARRTAVPPPSAPQTQGLRDEEAYTEPTIGTKG